MNNNQRVDPDPFTVAAVAIAAVSMVLQFVQTYRSVTQEDAQSRFLPPNDKDNQLNWLEQTGQQLTSSLRQLARSAERGSTDSDREYYDAPLRVSERILNLDDGTHIQFQQQLSSAYNQLGALSTWINLTINQNPVLARRLGERMSGGLSTTADTINSALAQGSPNRVVFAECRKALQELANAVEAELDQSSN